MSDFRLDADRLDILTLDGEPDTPVVPADEIWFAYFGLQNDNVLTEFIKVSAPDLDLTQRGFPRADGVYQETAYYRVNRIKLSGTLIADDRTSLEELMDEMRKYFATFGGTLRTSWGGVVRYYDDCYATNLNAIFEGREHFNIDWCPWAIEFVSQQPFARAGDRIILDAPYPITASPTVFIVDNAGTAVTDPIITLTVVTAGSLSSITMENGTNGDSITIADSFSDGDTIEINGEEKTVKINGVESDYTGVIPRAIPGNNTFTATLVGGGYSVSLTEQHYSRYL